MLIYHIGDFSVDKLASQEVKKYPVSEAYVEIAYQGILQLIRADR